MVLRYGAELTESLLEKEVFLDRMSDSVDDRSLLRLGFLAEKVSYFAANAKVVPINPKYNFLVTINSDFPDDFSWDYIAESLNRHNLYRMIDKSKELYVVRNSKRTISIPQKKVIIKHFIDDNGSNLLIGMGRPTKRLDHYFNNFIPDIFDISSKLIGHSDDLLKEQVLVSAQVKRSLDYGNLVA